MDRFGSKRLNNRSSLDQLFTWTRPVDRLNYYKMFDCSRRSQLLKHFVLTTIIMEDHSQLIINHVNHSTKSPDPATHVVEYIMNFVSYFQEVKFLFCYQKSNKGADALSE